MGILNALHKAIAGTDLSRDESREAFEEIMSGGATDAQIAAFIVALRMKGETIDEIAGAAQVMRDKVTRVVPASDKYLVDTCGTGGDGSNTFNISTAAALVAAGAGARVAKHGNRSVSSKSGSADVLEALGVNIAVEASVMKECLDSVGISFLFAPSLHKAMRYAIGPRKEIATRTIFNMLGPLTNPSGARRQVLGVFSEDLVETMANVLAALGSEKVYVVHGTDRLDEVSISSETAVAELSVGSVKTYRVKPEDFGIARAPRGAITGGDSVRNAAIIQDVLAGDRGPRRDIVVLNAAFALSASGLTDTIHDGIKLAAESIDSGAAAKKLRELAEQTKR